MNFLRDSLWLIVTYLLVAALFASTFFLHDVPLEVYQDAVLFTLPLLFPVLIYRGYRSWRRHHLLEQMLQQEWLHVLESWFPSENLLEEDYQRLLTKMEGQIRKVASDSDIKERELMEYYGMWSHQIKTPLAALDLMIQVLDSPVKAEMKEEVFKIQQYLDMMLQYLRMQSIQNDFRFETLAVKPLVTEVVKKYAGFFIRKNLELELNNLEGSVITDKKWLSFILEQVIFNAIKYTKAGGITIDAPKGEVKQLRIRDTGQGILPEDLPRVFEKGYTGFNGRENQKASGLGLYMCKEIAGQLGIGIAITSEIGRGTEVVLDFGEQLVSEG